MRNRNTALLATAFVAVTAGALALGITQGDKVKTFFASKEMYKNEQAQDATATTDTTSKESLAEATQTSQTLTNIQGSSLAATAETAPATASDTTTAAVEPTPAATEASTETSAGAPAMTQIDLDKAAAAPAASPTTESAASSLGAQPLTPEQVAAANAVPVATPDSAEAMGTESKGTFEVDVKKALENRTVGSASAPLTVHDFSSLTCPHCAHFHNDIFPKIKEKFIDTGKVRWMFNSFPLNEPALKAEMVARCAPGGDEEYFKLTDFMFKNQERWAYTDQPIPNLNMLLKIAGITDNIFLSCINNKELEAGMLKAAQEATTKYKIEATPTFVFNDGLKTFSGVGTYEGFADDLERTLQALSGPRKEKPLTDAAKETPAPSDKK